MAIKITFVYPDFQETVGGTQQHGSYSEGLASLSAVLKREGYTVSLYHLTSHPSKEQYIERIRQEEPDLIGIATRTSVFPFVQDYALWSKQALPKVPVVCGSYHPTLDPEETIASQGVDIVCLGEGEEALVELCNFLSERKAIDNINNLWVKKNGKVFKNPPRPLIEDLDSLPLPDFDLFDFANLASSRIKTAVVMVSRGCPYGCTYCCNHQLKEIYPNKGKYTRFRSPQKSIVYLKTIKNKYPYIKYINFMDNILPMKRAWFDEFIDLYKKEVNLPFSCRFRASLMDYEVVKLLKEAGCYLVHFGVESGNDYIRNDVLNRKMPVDQIKQAFEACRKLGVSTLSYNMINLPYEDMPKILETIKLNAELKPNRIVDTIFYPYPHTRLWQVALDADFIKPHFDYTQEIVLEQPTLSRKQVIFVQRYFRNFVRGYQLANKLPSFLGKPLAKVLDAIFCSRFTPYGFLVIVGNIRLKVIVGLKKFLMKYFPKVYLWLRDTVVRRGRKAEDAPAE